MKHTPGPWKYTYNKKFDRHVIRHSELVDRGDSNEIAGIYNSLDFKADEANANLIAAAPDLLEACKSALFDISLVINCKLEPSTMRAVLPKLRNAIKKAEGK